ncbi:MAG: dihydroorotase [Christensenellales bacterium]
MPTVLIKNASLVRDSVKEADVFVKDGIITKIGRVDRGADVVVNGEGKHLFYGFCDMHAHLREPGFESKETVASGVRAAVRGGFTDIACMPNTNPVNDNKVVTEYIIRRAREEGFANVYPVGAITKGSDGKELSEMSAMKNAGIIAVSDDGKPVSDGRMMRLALEYASTVGLPVLSHSEDKSLSADGVVNEGVAGEICGLKGITRAAEEAAVAREMILAETLGVPVHICHVSTRGSVELIRFFKKKGVKVTAETCPHYFALNDECIEKFDTNTKVNPPIRTEDDRTAVIEGIMDGTIDVIATDHAPHSASDKNTDYVSAAFGISGLETAFAISYSVLVKSGLIDIVKLNRLLSVRPREILGLDGRLREGEKANLTLADLNAGYVIDSANFVSKGRNTPFNGLSVYGLITDVIVNGAVKYLNGELVR